MFIIANFYGKIPLICWMSAVQKRPYTHTDTDTHTHTHTHIYIYSEWGREKEKLEHYFYGINEILLNYTALKIKQDNSPSPKLKKEQTEKWSILV